MPDRAAFSGPIGEICGLVAAADYTDVRQISRIKAAFAGLIDINFLPSAPGTLYGVGIYTTHHRG